MENKNACRTTVVCVDEYHKGVPEGRFINPGCGTVAFESLTDFLLKMEDMLDGMKLPQSFSARRSFGDAALVKLETDAGGKPQTGKRGTFQVRILFRQNASWQGSVTWLEGEKEESFRSVLELILLMDSALKLSKKK